jgi:serine/threonine-protein kinase HipA
MTTSSAGRRAGKPATTQLRVLMSGANAGWLRRDVSGRVSFRYDESYIATRGATPLSVLLPLAERPYAGRSLDAWLANLLPDNARVLDRWAANFQVSANSPFSLLAHVGADCAGAVQFIPENRLDQAGAGGLEPLTELEVGRRLAALAGDPAAWTPLHEGGQFSLAGAQPKIALRLQDEQWFEPWGVEATSHILKPPMPGLACQELNEHLCLQIARRLGLPAAESHVRTVGGQTVIVVTRYDRVRASNGRLLRLHQEDLCQALGVRPTSKYQADGGPRPDQIVALLRRVMPAAAASAAVATFVDALALSWVLAATDAHAKNYSLLLSGPAVRLAPLYDVNSVLPYLSGQRRNLPAGQVSVHTARLAMSIGGRAKLAEVDGKAWREQAASWRLDPDSLIEQVSRLTDSVAGLAGEVIAEACDSGNLTAAQQDFAAKLHADITRQAGLCRTALAGRGPRTRRRSPAPTPGNASAT